MKEIRALSITAAAALSVIAVPLIATLVIHLNTALLAAIVSPVAAVVGAGVTLVYSAASRGEWREAELRAEILRKALEAGRTDYPQVLALLRADRDPGEAQAEVQLLRELGALEREARTLLGERPSTSVIRIRSHLQDSGIWSEEDVYDFDVALRTRNRVAHGDQEGLTKTTLAEAIETMKRLRGKLEAIHISPPND